MTDEELARKIVTAAEEIGNDETKGIRMHPSVYKKLRQDRRSFLDAPTLSELIDHEVRNRIGEGCWAHWTHLTPQMHVVVSMHEQDVSVVPL